MSVLSRLASALGRNDERPNVELAQALVANADTAAIAELVGALSAGPQAVRKDAIKVLYEIGERQPELLDGHARAIFATLDSRDNRMVWGGLSALAAIATAQAGTLVARLPEILAAAGHGGTVLPILLDRLEGAAPNQFPMYAEIAAPVVDAANRPRLRRILEARLAAIPQRAKRARIEKVLRRLNK